MKEEIRKMAKEYADSLKANIDARVLEMDKDDTSHFLIYRVLGIAQSEGRLIDIYQNKGRFLYKSAGAFLEEAAKLLFKHRFPQSGTAYVPNAESRRPKNFEIDCLVDKDALEIKWRDATTDGDHIAKEHSRIRAICHAGYKPIRVMFYYPNREQAIRIQRTLETLYHGVKGEYYYGDSAWKYVAERTKIDLLKIIQELADENDALAAKAT